MSEENKAIVRRLFDEVVTKGNVELADEIIARDFVRFMAVVVLGGPDPQSVRGPEYIKQVVTSLHDAFANFYERIEDIIAEDDMVAVRVTLGGTHKGDYMGVAPTGKQVEWTAYRFLRIVDGKISVMWSAADVWGLMQQFGAVATPRLG